MNDLNLVLKFRLAGEESIQIKGAARIEVDGHGGLSFYDVQSGSVERIELSQIQSFSLRSMTRPLQNAA
jgi:hypothetical protein